MRGRKGTKSGGKGSLMCRMNKGGERKWGGGKVGMT